jgi:hypothetical protein
MKRPFFVGLVILALALSWRPAFAQTPKDGRLVITVTDQTGAVVQGASVTVVGLEPATKAATIAPTKTSDKGIATVDGLVLGRYSVQAEFPGFQLGLLTDLRVKSGDNKHVVVLPLKKMEESVTVERDRQASAAERNTTFGTALTREQIEALSDDPDEMARQLKDMAGPDAVIRVDSFEGQQLPPKAQIKAIHITRDQFAAENHSAGGIFVDIITQPGVGKLRTNTGMNFYDSSMDGNNPYVPRKGPARNQSYRGSIGGTLIKNKADFSIAVNGSDNYSTPILNAKDLSGSQVRNLDVRQPFKNVGMSGLINYAVTKDQTIRIGFNGGKSSSDNQGVGAFDYAERAYSTESDNFAIRAQEAGPLGRRFFTNTRFTFFGNTSTTQSATEAPTISVLDAFTSGGAQRRGGTHTKNMTLASDLDYVRGIHSVRAGVQLDAVHYRTDADSNYLGTYTFASLDTLAAGQPLSYTRRIGDPNIKYWQTQLGLYLQDDLRIRKSLTLSAGVRYEAQAHLKDYQNIGPRVGLTWAPFKSGKTTLRASWGVFYDWLSSNIYGQTLLVDGVHQQEINILDPTYPDPGVVGASLPSNRYLLGPNMQMARNMRGSAGISQTINSHLSMGATFSDVHSNGLLVGDNLNTPLNGLRPDPSFANVVETIPQGRSRAKTLSLFSSVNLARSNSGPGGGPMMVNGGMMMMAMGGGPAAPPKAPFFDWRRGLGLFVNYTLGKSENNTDGAFSVPATGDLGAEWGPAQFDIRHRASISINTSAVKNFNASIGISANSAGPLTIRTGFDDNGDGIFNDRPVGVGRNSERTSGYWSTFGFFSYSFGFGKSTGSAPPGIMITSGPGGITTQMGAAQVVPRYRLSLNVSVNNLTNHHVYTNYIGTQTSPFFLQPTSVSGVRSVNFSMGLSF